MNGERGDDWFDTTRPTGAEERPRPAPPPSGSGPARGDRRRLTTPDGRRLVPAGHVLLAVIVGFAIAVLVDAPGIRRAAEAQPLGAKRSVAVAFAGPLATVSHALLLDRPGQALRSALGKGGAAEKKGAKKGLADLGDPDAPAGVPKVLPTPTLAHPLRCWVGGDSMTQVFGQQLVTMMRETKVMRATLDYRISTGLSRPDYFDWPLHLQFQMDHLQPDLVVIMFGANDGQDVEYLDKVLKFGTKPWLRLYHQRVGEAMDIALRDGATRVYWVGQPITGLADFNQRLQIMNAVYGQEAAKRENIVFMPTWDLFTAPDGGYADYLKDPSGKLVLMRQGDDIHLTLVGGDRMATPVLAAIEAEYHLTK